jgi:hypothetical protein
MTTEILTTKKVGKGMSPAVKEKLHNLMKEESRMVQGIFQCFESPGGTVKISVHKYPTPEKGGIPPFEMTMTDGQTYEVPLYVARFLNGIDVTAGALGDANKRNINIGTCAYAIHGFAWKGDSAPSSGQDMRGIPVPMIGITKRVRRYGFQSLEFAGEWAA